MVAVRSESDFSGFSCVFSWRSLKNVSIAGSSNETSNNNNNSNNNNSNSNSNSSNNKNNNFYSHYTVSSSVHDRLFRFSDPSVETGSRRDRVPGSLLRVVLDWNSIKNRSVVLDVAGSLVPAENNQRRMISHDIACLSMCLCFSVPHLPYTDPFSYLNGSVSPAPAPGFVGLVPPVTGLVVRHDEAVGPSGSDDQIVRRPGIPTSRWWMLRV